MRRRITFKERFILTLTWPIWTTVIAVFMIIAFVLFSLGSLMSLLFAPKLTVKTDKDEISVSNEDKNDD